MRKSTAQKRKIRSLYVKRRNKKVKSALLAGFAFSLLGLFFLIKSVIVPAVSAYSSGSSDLKDRDIYSILMIELGEDNLIKSAKVVVIQREDAKLYSITIPVDLKVDLPGRFGEEEYRKILKLANTVGDEVNSAGLLVDASKEILKLNIDRYVLADTEMMDVINRAIFSRELTLLVPWEMQSFLRSAKHNLSGRELLDLLKFSRSLSDRDTYYFDLSQVADLGLKMRDITLNGKVAKESLGIVVLNGTGVANVAGEVSEVFQNMGARISLTANAENEYEKSYLVTDDPLSSTARYIKSYYPTINIVSNASALSLGEGLMDRGDICVIVGFDILAQQE